MKSAAEGREFKDQQMNQPNLPKAVMAGIARKGGRMTF